MNLRIAFLSANMKTGGAERVVATLASSLAMRGHAVDLVLMDAQGSLLAEVAPQVRIIDLGTKRASRSVFAIARYLRAARPSVLVSGIEHVNAAAVLARILSRTPVRVAVTVHGYGETSETYGDSAKQKALGLLTRYLYRAADAVIAVSAGVADDVARRRRLPRETVRVIYNPVRTSHVRRLAAAPADCAWLDSGEPVIVFAGRLAAEKCCEDLIEAFALLRAKRPARLLLLGDGPQRNELERTVRRHGIGDAVSFAGFVGNPYPYLARAAVVVLPSRSEGFGNAVAEALTLGVPVVAMSGSGGPEEILDYGRFGRLVPPGDIPALAAALEASIDSPADATRLRRRADEFDEERILPQYLALLTELAGAPRQRRKEVAFDFGANWAAFLTKLTPERIADAEESLRTSFGVRELKGLSFVDAGSGSGLFSLAAHRLGARVHSFDYLESSAACTRQLQRRYAAAGERWAVDCASVLDRAYIASLGRFDIVYTWGVLHHTGALWQALEHAIQLVGNNGRLLVALGNDQGWKSRFWQFVKHAYNVAPRPLRGLAAALLFVSLRILRPVKRLWRGPAQMMGGNQRGMVAWNDAVDWLGGYPYDVARPDEVVAFCRARGLEPLAVRTTKGLGNNEFLFQRRSKQE
jgi:glycosyltransferase involved in cell wall biosynthesis/2-polyprenyl-3-methyl-5-hydroxy-6-metoxy-1,4-benzoquinol methylase